MRLFIKDLVKYFKKYSEKYYNIVHVHVVKLKKKILNFYIIASHLINAYKTEIEELCSPFKVALFLCFLLFNIAFGRCYIPCLSIVLYLGKKIGEQCVISA